MRIETTRLWLKLSHLLIVADDLKGPMPKLPAEAPASNPNEKAEKQFEEYRTEHPGTQKTVQDFLEKSTRSGKKIPNVSNLIYTDNRKMPTLNDTRNAERHGEMLAGKMSRHSSPWGYDDHMDAAQAHAEKSAEYSTQKDQLAKGASPSDGATQAKIQQLSAKALLHNNAAKQHTSAAWHSKINRNLVKPSPRVTQTNNPIRKQPTSV